MNGDSNQNLTTTLKTTPSGQECTMPERKLCRPGDFINLTVTFQVLKTLGHEDRVYHLITPVDDTKHLMCLQDPFFVACVECDEPDMPVIPTAVLERAQQFVSVEDPGEDHKGHGHEGEE